MKVEGKLLRLLKKPLKGWRGKSLDDLEKTILSWLKNQNDNWCWFFGKEKLDKKVTIKKFRSDKDFRKLVVMAVHKRAIDLFESDLKKEGKI
jgi:hypothetical protein